MPITELTMDSGASTQNIARYNTNTVAVSANQLVIIGITNSVTTTPAGTPTVDGLGLTFVQIATALMSGSKQRVTMLRTMTAAAVAGTLGIDYAGTNQTGNAYSIFQFASADSSGTWGSGAIVQSASATAINTGTLVITLNAFSSVNNGASAVYGIDNNITSTPDAGWTEIADLSYVTPATAHESQWRNDNDTTATVTTATTGNTFGGIAIEIAVSAAAAAAAVEDQSYVFTA